MIKIGIDISLSSTAIYINGDTDYIFCYLNKTKVNKWAKKISTIENVTIHRSDVSSNNKIGYSDSEIDKLTKYDILSDKIINDLVSVCGDELCDVRIEGYAYTKNTNSIIDIICLSTLIRLKILKTLNCKIRIIPPMSLKTETCEYCYGVTEIKRYHKKTNAPLKSEFKIMNDDGIVGGNFTKFEIYNSIIEKNVDNIFLDFLKENAEVLEMKKIPSPIDDINDALMLSKI